MLSENEIISETLFLNIDPIHLNDIEPAFENTNYWKYGLCWFSSNPIFEEKASKFNNAWL